MEELIRKITEEGYKYIGIRHLAEDEEYEVGDICRNSYNWDYEYDRSSYESDAPVELPGTCAYNAHIETGWDEDEEIIEKIKNAYPSHPAIAGKSQLLLETLQHTGMIRKKLL